MKKVFVSGCYDIIHGGHVQFFEEARALGDHLTVSFASSEVLWIHKRRKPSIPDEHKKALLESLRVVDLVVVGRGIEEGIDFREHFLALRPDVLAVTEDDKYAHLKRALCAEVGATYVVLPKTPPRFEPVSTSSIVRFVQAPTEAPLRVDFAGGWLDVPRYAREGEFIEGGSSNDPRLIVGRIDPLHLRADIDEFEIARLKPGAKAIASPRGDAERKYELQFVRYEPLVIPKKSLTGDSIERVDTRVLQAVFRLTSPDDRLFVGQQMDVFIESNPRNSDS